MKRPGVLEGIVLALVAAATAAVVFPVLTILLAPGAVLRLIIAGLSFSYLCYLLQRSEQKVGRITLVLGWCLLAVTAWVFAPSLLTYAAIHLVIIWLVRSLYFYNSVLSALADLGLTGLALIVALWAWLTSGSLFLVVWCLFLVQALFVVIPRHFAQTAKSANSAVSLSPEDSFETAYRAAEQALRKFIRTN